MLVAAPGQLQTSVRRRRFEGQVDACGRPPSQDEWSALRPLSRRLMASLTKDVAASLALASTATSA
jgi:hypothetical protein